MRLGVLLCLVFVLTSCGETQPKRYKWVYALELEYYGGELDTTYISIPHVDGEGDFIRFRRMFTAPDSAWAGKSPNAERRKYEKWSENYGTVYIVGYPDQEQFQRDRVGQFNWHRLIMNYRKTEVSMYEYAQLVSGKSPHTDGCPLLDGTGKCFCGPSLGGFMRYFLFRQILK